MSSRPDIAPLATLLGACELIDLSPTIQPGMPGWPTHPAVELQRTARSHAEHGYFAQTLVLSEHSGCHVDAPAHAFDHGTTIDHFALDALIGPAKKIDVSGLDLHPGEVLNYTDFHHVMERDGIDVVSGDIVLFEFGWDGRFLAETNDPVGHRGWWGANEPGLDEDTCRFLSDKGIRAVGADTAGCDIAEIDGRIVSAFGHQTWFLPREIPIIEGLHGLSRAPTEFVFVALPLKISAGSGSPLRAVALVPPG